MTRFALPLICTLLLGAAPSAAAVARPDPPPAAARWAEVDRNGDGAIDRAEAAARPRLAERFDRIDTDHDARIEPTELREAARMAATQREVRQARARAMRARFDWLDANDDRALTLAEIGDRAPRLTERFAAIDTDRNGQLVPEELRTYLRALRAEARRRGQPS